VLVSVLDQSPISEDSTGAQALRNTIELATLADRLGYHRYWVAEHHGGPMLAGPSPEALIGPIASAAPSIRVGSGGVMLPHYSPLKVAESFSLLAGLFPGRIDLALGRAPGSDQMTMFALQRDRRQAAPDDFPQQLAELLAYLDDDLPEDHPFRHLARTLPGRPELPVPWLLGSSAQSGEWAAELGLRYAFADFINSSGATIAHQYQSAFQPARDLQAPYTAIGIWVLCAPTDEEAEFLATSSRMAFTMLRRGQLIPVPSPEKASEWLQREGRTLGVGGGESRGGRRTIVGSPEKVRAGIEEAVSEYRADEAIVVTITHDHAARLRSYELVADAMGLEQRLVSDGVPHVSPAAAA
jgi:luciferase family oxidoreductase group 1